MNSIPDPADPLAPPACDADPWAMETLLDPYPMFDGVRSLAPVVWLSRYGMYAVARHEEAKQVFSDHSRFIAGAGTTMHDIRKGGQFRIPSRLGDVDPPVHTNVRTVITRIMSPPIIRRMKLAFEEEAAKLAETLVAKGRFEAVNEMIETFIIEAFPAAVGVKLERKKALAIAEMRFNQSGPHNALYQRAMTEAEPYLDWFNAACAEDAVEPGSISALLFEAERAGLLDEGVASNIVRTFVGGGVDSTISAVGHTLHELARHPDCVALIKSDPRKVRPAFEEAIRLHTPFQYTWRTTEAEVMLSGYKLAADTKVTIMSGAANRDPRRWTDPDRFDVTRDTLGNYLGFGAGNHNCIGQMIARQEADAILLALLSRIGSLELDGDVTYHPINQMRMLELLPVRVTPA